MIGSSCKLWKKLALVAIGWISAPIHLITAVIAAVPIRTISWTVVAVTGLCIVVANVRRLRGRAMAIVKDAVSSLLRVAD